MSFERLLSKIASLFRKTRIPYMLVGGFAVAYWGYPRQSLDIDIVLDLNESKLNSFLSIATGKGFNLDEREIKTILSPGNRFVMEADDFRIDCWLPKTRYEKLALEGRKRRMVFGVNLYVINPEDLIISKLLVGRARDTEDIKTILLRQGRKIDKTYLRRQAIGANVTDSLEQINKALL